MTNKSNKTQTLKQFSSHQIMVESKKFTLIAIKVKAF